MAKRILVRPIHDGAVKAVVKEDAVEGEDVSREIGIDPAGGVCTAHRSGRHGGADRRSGQGGDGTAGANGAPFRRIPAKGVRGWRGLSSWHGGEYSNPPPERQGETRECGSRLLPFMRRHARLPAPPSRRTAAEPPDMKRPPILPLLLVLAPLFAAGPATPPRMRPQPARTASRWLAAGTRAPRVRGVDANCASGRGRRSRSRPMRRRPRATATRSASLRANEVATSASGRRTTSRSSARARRRRFSTRTGAPPPARI